MIKSRHEFDICYILNGIIMKYSDQVVKKRFCTSFTILVCSLSFCLLKTELRFISA